MEIFAPNLLEIKNLSEISHFERKHEMLSATGTAYPRFKTNLSKKELEQLYTPTSKELDFCFSKTRDPQNYFGLIVLLKSFQRLGHFVKSREIPERIINHIAVYLDIKNPDEILKNYDESRIRRIHFDFVREYLGVKAFSYGGSYVLRQALREAAVTREDLSDIINMGVFEKSLEVSWFGGFCPKPQNFCGRF